LSVVSALPVLWLQHRVAWHPMITFLAGGVLYTGAYALLSYGPMLRERLQPGLAIPAVGSVRLQPDRE
jgi:hypothetical protein